VIHDGVYNVVVKSFSYLFFSNVLDNSIEQSALRHFYGTLLKIQGRKPRITMEFTVEKPAYDSVNGCHQLTINSPPVFVCEGGDLSGMTFTEGLGEQLRTFVQGFLQKASSFFSKPLNLGLFQDRLAHHYSLGEHELAGVAVKQLSWIPARILFFPTRYEIRWRLLGFEKVEVSPGTTIQEAEIEAISAKPPPRRMRPAATVQHDIRQKIRQARIRCAFAKLQLERMIEKYYAKYGSLDGLGAANSELSSEGE
jgi:hypothetical protein